MRLMTLKELRSIIAETMKLVGGQDEFGNVLCKHGEFIEQWCDKCDGPNPDDQEYDDGEGVPIYVKSKLPNNVVPFRKK